MFAPNSRYFALPTATFEDPDTGVAIIYVTRRFAPQPESLALLQEHVVALNDRLDLIAARYYDDPELFWRVADGNHELRPEDLTQPVGRRLRITLPQGVPGVPGA